MTVIEASKCDNWTHLTGRPKQSPRGWALKAGVFTLARPPRTAALVTGLPSHQVPVGLAGTGCGTGTVSLRIGALALPLHTAGVSSPAPLPHQVYNQPAEELTPLLRSRSSQGGQWYAWSTALRKSVSH